MGKTKENFLETREKQSLFKIEMEYLELEQDLYDAAGELTPELEERLAINEESLKRKSQGYIYIIKKAENDVKIIAEEIKRLTALKKARSKAVERMKNSIERAMTTYEINEILLPLNKINFRKSKSIVISVDPEELQKDCQKIEIKAISKTELKDRINAGEVIPGVELVDNNNLQIK